MKTAAETLEPFKTAGPPRIAVTMWEFSWLVRRRGAENEYADWDRVLDELVERGYDCIRIDAFPHLVAAGASGDRRDRFTILSQQKDFMWGNHDPVEVEPRPGLVEFMSKAADRSLVIGLSTWFNDDSTHRAADVCTPADYARIWHETLDLLRTEGLLDIVSWVDLCNEWPIGAWARGAYPEIFGRPHDDIAGALQPWTDRDCEAVVAYFDAVGELRSEFPGLKYTFSFAPIAWNVRRLDVSSFDIAEPHIWLASDVEEFMTSTEILAALSERPGALERHIELVDELYWTRRDHWIAQLASKMDAWASWAQEHSLPLYTSEGWASVNYADLSLPSGRSSWDYVKDAGRAAVELAVEKGWTGICTSNFSQPHFPGIWADVDWHRELTGLIHASG